MLRTTGDVGDLYISLGVDNSGLISELVKSEQVASGTAGRIKDKLLTVSSSLGNLRKEAAQVKAALASATDFRVRGDAALDTLHAQLGKVRESGSASTKTLDSLSLRFEQASRGAKSYTQALDKVAADKGATDAVRNLARALSDEAKEANLSTAALEKRQTAINRQIARERRSFTTLLRQSEKEEHPHQAPPQSAASGVVRLLAGEFSIRSGERFLSTTLGLGPALQAVFPVVGGLAMVDIFGQLIDRTGEWYEKLQLLRNQPRVIAEAFQQINQPIAVANDQLRITNDRLANDIAKLEGKPENHLKEAIDEARLAADKLGESLTKDFSALQKLLQEHNVGNWQRLIGNIPTTDIREELFGKTGLGGVKAQVDEATRDSSKQQAQFGQQLDAAKTDAERKSIFAQSDKALDRSQKQVTDILQPVISKSDTHLANLLKQQEIYSRYHAGDPALRLAAIEETRTTGHAPEYTYDRSSAIEIEKARNILLHETQEDAIEQIKNSKLNARLKKDQGDKDAAALTRPYQDKIKELDAQLDGLKNQLASIGQSSAAETLAKSWAKAQEEIARLNNELAQHRQSLSLDQQLEILTRLDQQASVQSEIEWKTKLDQTTTSIDSRISSLKLLTEAIGKGAAAEREAAVQSQLLQALGKDRDKLNDSTWLDAKDPVTGTMHRAQIEQLRTGIGNEYDAEQARQQSENIDKLKDQIELEKSLATAQKNGAEALRLVTLAYRLRNLAMQAGARDANGNLTPGTQQQIKSEIDLANAQKRNKDAGDLAKVNEEIDATKRLSAAQVQGAEAYRRAQLEIKYEEMGKAGASPEVIQQTRSLDEAKHQAEIVDGALRTGLAYQNQLESINQQISALQQIRATQGDSLNVEISLKALEVERTRVLSDQMLAVGTMRDGMVAFFREMATEGESAAQQVHDAFRSAFGGVNDELSKLMTGQKTSWGSMLQQLGQQISKMGLRDLEHAIAAKVFSPKTPGIIAGTVGQQTAGQPATSKGGVIGLLGRIFNPAGESSKRDGNTPASAFYVTLVGANGIPQWSSAPQSNADQSTMLTPPFLPYPIRLPNLQHPQPEQPRDSMQTLQNGALTKPPGFGSVLLHSAIQIGAGLATSAAGGHSGGSSDSGSSSGGVLPGDPGSSVSGTGPNAGMQLTRLPSGLILRQPEGGAYAAGGRPPVGKASLVGEKGPELFVPDKPGTIIPNHRLEDFAGTRNKEALKTFAAAANGGGTREAMASLAASSASTKFGGYRATGGDVDASRAYIVGEEGPEILTGVSGRIASNSASRRELRRSGGDTYNVDARGSQDPYLTRHTVEQAIRAAHSSAIVTSTQVQAERAKRTPQR